MVRKKYEDIKVVTRSRKAKKDRQCNGKKKKDQCTNKDPG